MGRSPTHDHSDCSNPRRHRPSPRASDAREPREQPHVERSQAVGDERRRVGRKRVGDSDVILGAASDVNHGALYWKESSFEGAIAENLERREGEGAGTDARRFLRRGRHDLESKFVLSNPDYITMRKLL